MTQQLRWSKIPRIAAVESAPWTKPSTNICGSAGAADCRMTAAKQSRHLIRGMTNSDILSELRRGIVRFQAMSFERYSLRVGIYLEACSVQVGYCKCILSFQGHEMHLRVREKSPGKLLLLHANGWTTLTEVLEDALRLLPRASHWLNDSKDASGKIPLTFKQLLWDHQMSWWQANGKSFRFFDLPFELREQILGEVFRAAVHPFPKNKSRRLTGLGIRRLANENPDLLFLKSSKRLYQEARDVIFNHAMFVIEHRHILGRVRDTNITARIRNLAFSLDNEQYFGLFGFQCTAAGISHERHDVANVLFHMKLKTLTIHILMHTQACSDDDDYCQTTYAGWVLQAVTPFVEHHPVIIEGFARVWQKEKFAAQFARAREGYKHWLELKPPEHVTGTPAEYLDWTGDDGGVRLSQTSPALALPLEDEAEGNDGDGRCRCPVNCMRAESWLENDVRYVGKSFTTPHLTGWRV